MLLAGTIWSLFKSPSQLFSVQTAKAFVLPFLLILWTIPFAYLFAVKVAYESLFTRIDLGRWQERSIRFYTAYKIVATGHLNASRIKRMSKLLCRKTDDLKTHRQTDDLFAALRICLEDKENNDSRDFIWPEPELFEGESRYSSLEEYFEDSLPLVDQLIELWESTIEAFSDFPDEDEVHPVLNKFLISQWSKVSNLRQKIDLLDRAPIVAEYFDRELRMLSADLRQVYWYSSPENPSQNHSYRRGSIVFRNYERAKAQCARFQRASRKLYELASFN